MWLENGRFFDHNIDENDSKAAGIEMLATADRYYLENLIELLLQFIFRSVTRDHNTFFLRLRVCSVSILDFNLFVHE